MSPGGVGACLFARPGGGALQCGCRRHRPIFARLLLLEPLIMKQELTAERLRELLSYDPETGIFTCRSGKWLAHIRVNGKKHFLGRHATPEAARTAYCAGAHEAFGKYARMA